MAHFILIACVSTKASTPTQARDLYQSALFRKALDYADSLRPDGIFILSAKYGLVSANDRIAPYDETLNDKLLSEVRSWAERVIAALQEVADLECDTFTILAGDRYRRFLLPHLPHAVVPLQGLTIGRQLQALGDLINPKPEEIGACAWAHRMLRSRELHTFPFDATRIPRNGLYVLFEKGEEAHGGMRIVRVGTHTGQNRLRSRLGQHFLREKKDRSIFRKNIGRCQLARSNDKYLPIWEKDFTTQAARLARPTEFDANRQATIEADVSRYIRESFSFVTVEVVEKDDRLRSESGLVSLVSRCPDCGPSGAWLGLRSPRDRIQRSGLWQVNELYKTPLTFAELRDLLGDAQR